MCRRRRNSSPERNERRRRRRLHDDLASDLHQTCWASAEEYNTVTPYQVFRVRVKRREVAIMEEDWPFSKNSALQLLKNLLAQSSNTVK
jgi:hypothetical protein